MYAEGSYVRQIFPFILLAISMVTAAQELHTFSNGEVADAEKINENFDQISKDLPPSDCDVDQIIRWSGIAWQCADNPLAVEGCNDGDPVRFMNGALTCDSPPPTSECQAPGTVITDDNFQNAIDRWFEVGAASEYGDITQWCTGSVTNMDYAFNFERSFNEDIGNWDTSNVTSMNSMFNYAHRFNRDISRWDTSKVTNMNSMFYRAYDFNQEIGNWNTGAVEVMQSMFSYANSFSANIGDWDVSSVRDMSYMFRGASSLQSDLATWDVGQVTDMGGMFDGAVSFNKDIGAWDVSSVRRMTEMFRGATSFNQDLTGWIAQSLNLNKCTEFAKNATAWLSEYSGSIAGKTPPLSETLINAGCSE